MTTTDYPTMPQSTANIDSDKLLRMVQHPRGYLVFVPEGAEHFFNLAARAIRRYPDCPLRSPEDAGDFCECLTTGELAQIADWLETLMHLHVNQGFVRNKKAFLQGWATAISATVVERLERRRSVSSPRTRWNYDDPTQWIEVRTSYQSPVFIPVPAEARAFVKIVRPAFQREQEVLDPEDAGWWTKCLTDEDLAEAAHWLQGYFAWVDARYDREHDICDIHEWAGDMLGAAEAEIRRRMSLAYRPDHDITGWIQECLPSSARIAPRDTGGLDHPSASTWIPRRDWPWQS